MDILIVLTNHTKLGETPRKTGYHLNEIAYIYMFLKKAGHQVDFCSPRGFRTKVDPKSLEFLGDEVISDFFRNFEIKKKLQSTLHPKNIQRDYQGIVFCGGHGCMWDFPENLNLKKLTINIYESLGLVSSIGHGAAIFANLKLTNGSYLVSNKKITCFSDDEEKNIQLETVVPFLLESRLVSIGAKYSKKDIFKPHVERDNRILTAQNHVSSKIFAESLVERLKWLK